MVSKITYLNLNCVQIEIHGNWSPQWKNSSSRMKTIPLFANKLQLNTWPVSSLLLLLQTNSSIRFSIIHTQMRKLPTFFVKHLEFREWPTSHSNYATMPVWLLPNNCAILYKLWIHGLAPQASNIEMFIQYNLL